MEGGRTRSRCSPGGLGSGGAGLGGVEGREQPSWLSFFLLPGPLILISGRNSLEKDVSGNECVCADWLQPLVL